MSSPLHIHIHVEDINLSPTPQQYADSTGQNLDAVVSQMNRGQLPIFYLDDDSSKERRKRYVNVLAILSKQALEAEISLVL